MNNFKTKLKNFRKENNLTQEDLAKKLYVTRQAISKWETGANFPDVEKLKDLAVLMNTSIDNLISQEELAYETINVSNKFRKTRIINYIIFSIFGFIIVVLLSIFCLKYCNKIGKEQNKINSHDYELMGLLIGFTANEPSLERIKNREYAGVFYEYQTFTNDEYTENAKIKMGYNFYDYKISVSDNIIKNEMIVYYDASLDENELKIWECYVNIDTNEYFFREVYPYSIIKGESSIVLFHSVKGMNRINKESEYNLVNEVFSIVLYEKYKTQKYEITEYELINNEYIKIKETMYEEFKDIYHIQDNCDKVVIKQYYGDKNKQEEYVGVSEIIINDNKSHSIILNYADYYGWYTKTIKIVK